MALDCRIIRDDNGNLKKVEAPNGEKSILFDKLKNFFGEKKALELYALTETEAFKNLMSYKRGVFLNEQKEKLDQIATDLSNIDKSVQIAIQRNNGNPLTLAPNGKPSILYQSYKDLGYSDVEAERLTAQVYSDEFKKFYKDSLLLDKNKQPILMFHGTNANFTVFDTTEDGELGRKDGIWDAEYPDGYMFFTSSQKNAKYYGKNIMPVFLSLPYAELKKVKKGGSLVKPFDDEGLAFEGDAIVTDGDTFVAGTMDEFSIKSATENVGTFDTTNPDIRFSVGEEKTAGEINQELIDKLKQNGLSEDVFLMSTQEIDAKLKELGVSDDVRKQVIAYHGSPYSFERFEFSDRTFLSGESAAAFGAGLYFTDLESIAKNYANNENLIERHLNSVYEFGAPDRFYQIPDDNRKSKESILSYIDNQIKGFENVPFQQKEWQKLKDAVQSYKPNLYKVSLHKGKTPSEYTWLEWDREVPKNLVSNIRELEKELFEIIGTNLDSSGNKIDIIEGTYGKSVEGVYDRFEPEDDNGNFIDWLGQNVYQNLDNILFDNKQASLLLLKHGIDGIKYPAESISRGATSDTARGFNYVVFDENAITIEEQIQFQKALSQVGIDMIVNGFVYNEALDPRNILNEMINKGLIEKIC